MMNKNKKWPQKPSRNQKVRFQIFLSSPSYPYSRLWYTHCQSEAKGYIKAGQVSFKIDSLNTITAYLKKMRDETKKTGKNKTKEWACVHDIQDDFINRRINRKMIAINKQKEQRYSEKIIW